MILRHWSWESRRLLMPTMIAGHCGGAKMGFVNIQLPTSLV
jgi:hypothetical protein